MAPVLGHITPYPTPDPLPPLAFRDDSQEGWPGIGILTAATQPRPFRSGCVVVAGPVHALDALVPVDDLEDLTDEGTGLLGSILVQRGGQSSVLP